MVKSEDGADNQEVELDLPDPSTAKSGSRAKAALVVGLVIGLFVLGFFTLGTSTSPDEDPPAATAPLEFCAAILDLGTGGIRPPSELETIYRTLEANAPAAIDDAVVEFVNLARGVSAAAEAAGAPGEADVAVFDQGMTPEQRQWLRDLDQMNRGEEAPPGPARTVFEFVFANCDPPE